MQKITFILGLILGLSVYGTAQVNFTANASKSKVAVGQRFSVEFSVNERGSNFRAPDFSGFQVLSGPNTSISTYADNRGVRTSIAYGYILVPRSQGQLTIGPAFIQIDGETYRTEPLEITVTEKPEEPAGGNQGKNEDAFVRAVLSKQKVYQGEPIYAAYKIYHRNNVGDIQEFKEPSFPGFYKEEIKQNKLDYEREKVNGRSFISTEIRKLVLIPQRAGTLKPGQVSITLPVKELTGRHDIFGRPLGRMVERELSDNFPAIEVLPLPESGKPSSFSGAVGQFDFKVNLSTTELTTDESLSLKIELSGSGNIKLASLPDIEFPQAFETFDPEKEEKISVGAYGMRGSKSVEYLMVPRYSGTYKIGPIEFSYFDPSSRSYKTVKSEVFEVKVTGGIAPPSGSTPAMAGGEKESVNFIGKDVLFIKTKAENWKNRDAQFLNSQAFFAWLFGLVGLTLILIAYQQYSMRTGQDMSLVRQQKAGKQARKHLAKAKKELKQNKKEGFYQALATALWGYFSDKLNIPQSKMSKDAIAEELQSRAVDPALQEQVLNIMNRAEMARYTNLEGTSLQEDYDETARLLTEIEKQI